MVWIYGYTLGIDIKEIMGLRCSPFFYVLIQPKNLSYCLLNDIKTDLELFLAYYEWRYQSDRRFGRIFSLFALLSILISCLGLFGLAAFMAEQRTKEIGIRRVLGATTSRIVYLLSREFVKWVLASNLIAWPIAYYVMNRWLQNFAFRTDLGIGIFFLATFMSLIIAIFTVIYQSVKTAYI